MPTFIIKNNPGLKKPIELTKDDEHHLKKVLRAKVGEVFSVTDNEGAIGKIKMTNHNPMQFELIETTQGAKPFPINMFMPLIEQTRLEWAIEKLTELNIETVQLVITERTQNKNFSEKKITRLQKIAETAQKQCGRAYPLKILKSEKLLEIISNLKTENTLKVRENIPSGGTGLRCAVAASAAQAASYYLYSENIFYLVIGPEGGLTPSESAMLLNKGFQGTSLGPTILRTETAALVLTAKVLQLKNP